MRKTLAALANWRADRCAALAQETDRIEEMYRLLNWADFWTDVELLVSREIGWRDIRHRRRARRAMTIQARWPS